MTPTGRGIFFSLLVIWSQTFLCHSENVVCNLKIKQLVTICKVKNVICHDFAKDWVVFVTGDKCY